MTNTAIPPFYASTGARLVRWQIDPQTLALRAESELTLPSPVHYVWPHPRLQDLLYVGASRHFFFPEAGGHCLVLVRVAADGALRAVGEPLPLRFRPIHITVDPAGQHLLVVGNTPPSIAVFRLAPDGTVGPEVPQDPALRLGVYPHQVRVAPDGSFVLVTERGNNAAAGRPEDPGALRLFHWQDGRLAPAQVLAPAGGYGFGPRHADFHLGGRWMYLALERQQQLQAWAVQSGGLGEAPFATVSTLRRDEDAGAEQLAGAVHVHPRGHVAYVSNRTGTVADADGAMPYQVGDNSMAVFSLDPQTGVPRLVQNVDTGAYHFRTFSLAGDVLVASSLAPTRIPDCGGNTVVPAGFTVFRIADDGQLTMEHQQPVDTGPGMLFWSGFLEAYRPV